MKPGDLREFRVGYAAGTDIQWGTIFMVVSVDNNGPEETSWVTVTRGGLLGRWTLNFIKANSVPVK